MIPELKLVDGKERQSVKEILIHHDVCPLNWTIWDISAVDYKRLYLANNVMHSGHFKDGREVFYAYHWLILPDGQTIKMLNDDEIGWHAGNWQVNKTSIAIAFHGTYTNEPPSDAAIQACAQLIKNYKLPYRFHRDVVPTICPGNWDRVILDNAIQGAGEDKKEYDFELLNQSEYPTLLPGETANISFLLKNTGKKSWKPNEFKLGVNNPKDSPSLLYNSDWIAISRPCTVPKEVVAGEEILLDVSITVPKNGKGEYKLELCPLIEGVEWLKDIGIFTLIMVK